VGESTSSKAAEEEATLRSWKTGFKSNQRGAKRPRGVDQPTDNYLSMRSAGCQSRQMPMPMPRGGENQTIPSPGSHFPPLWPRIFFSFFLALMIALTMPSSARTATNDVAHLRNGYWRLGSEDWGLWPRAEATGHGTQDTRRRTQVVGLETPSLSWRLKCWIMTLILAAAIA